MIRSFRSFRSLALGLGAAAALALVGCSQNGSYRLSWDFFATSAGSGPTQSAAMGCGQHGVDSIAAAGTDETGDAIEVTAICTPGVFTGTAPDGMWTFTFRMFDARGVLIPSSAKAVQPAAQPIASEGPAAAFSVTFVPPAACGDGIDNDGNGLVDTAGSECDAGSTAALDASGDGDGGGTGTRDGGPAGTPDGGVAGTQDGGATGAQDGASSGARG